MGVHYDLREAEENLRKIFSAPAPPEAGNSAGIRLGQMAVEAKVQFAVWLLRIENEGAAPADMLEAAANVLAGIITNAGRNIAGEDVTLPLMATVAAHILDGERIDGAGFEMAPMQGGRA